MIRSGNSIDLGIFKHQSQKGWENGGGDEENDSLHAMDISFLTSKSYPRSACAVQSSRVVDMCTLR